VGVVMVDGEVPIVVIRVDGGERSKYEYYMV